MNRNHKLLLRGVGIGIILTATLFFLVMTFSVPRKQISLTDAEIIDRARTLGMIFVSELTDEGSAQDSTGDNQVTTDLVIKDE